MADTGTRRRGLPLLAVSWAFAAGSALGFAWLTTGSYVRQALRPLPGEAGVTERDCLAVGSCAPDAADLVREQVALLELASGLAYASAWSLTGLAALTIAALTLLTVRRRRAAAARLAGVAWKVQAASATVAVIAHCVVLSLGARTLADTPDAARMFTFGKAFDSPFTDAGNLYYLAWLAAVGATAAILTRAHRHSV